MQNNSYQSYLNAYLQQCNYNFVKSIGEEKSFPIFQLYNTENKTYSVLKVLFTGSFGSQPQSVVEKKKKLTNTEVNCLNQKIDLFIGGIQQK